MYSLLLTGNISTYKFKNFGDELNIIENSKNLALHIKLSYFNTSNKEADFMISTFLFKTIYLKIIE